MPVPDSDLTSQFVEGDSDALAELVRRHVDLVFSAARRQVGGDAHAAEDVVQIVFARFVKKAATLRDRASLAGWFYTTTHHVSSNFVRSERRRKRREAEAYVMDNIIAQAAPEADWRQLPLAECNVSHADALARQFNLLKDNYGSWSVVDNKLSFNDKRLIEQWNDAARELFRIAENCEALERKLLIQADSKSK